MADQQQPKRRPRPYGRPRKKGHTHLKAQTSLPADAARAVLAVMRRHNLSRSGAIHHLVRLGAGLDPLI